MASDNTKEILKVVRHMDRTLTQIQRTLNRIAPPDADEFDPDEDDVTEDDLPFM